MDPFESLYGRRCRSPIGWFDAFEMRPWGTDLLRLSLDNVNFIKQKLLSAKSRQRRMQIGRLGTWSIWRVSKSCLKFQP